LGITVRANAECVGVGLRHLFIVPEPTDIPQFDSNSNYGTLVRDVEVVGVAKFRGCHDFPPPPGVLIIGSRFIPLGPPLSGRQRGGAAPRGPCKMGSIHINNNISFILDLFIALRFLLISDGHSAIRLSFR